MTLTRSPVGRRASTIGLDSSTRRLTVETMRSMVCISCSCEAKRSGQLLDPAGPLDEDLVRAVDHDLGDRGVLQERFEHAEAERLVDDPADQLGALGGGQHRALAADDVARARAPGAPGARPRRERGHLGEVDLLEQLGAVDGDQVAVLRGLSPSSGVLIRDRRLMGQLSFGGSSVGSVVGRASVARVDGPARGHERDDGGTWTRDGRGGRVGRRRRADTFGVEPAAHRGLARRLPSPGPARPPGRRPGRPYRPAGRRTRPGPAGWRPARRAAGSGRKPTNSRWRRPGRRRERAVRAARRSRVPGDAHRQSSPLQAAPRLAVDRPAESKPGKSTGT